MFEKNWFRYEYWLDYFTGLLSEIAAKTVKIYQNYCKMGLIYSQNAFLLKSHRGAPMNFKKSEGTPRVPQNYLATRSWKSGLISTHLALLGSYGLKSAQNSLIALKIAPLGPPKSKMGFYLKIGQVLADLWPIYRDRKWRIF